ncbi:MAG: hypothetical protein HZA90_01655 [Verrucomicrobia bacterium]|nr:hypothetical protein [Verrucomicrobiota bacterium]
MKPRLLLIGLLVALIAAPSSNWSAESAIDFQRARQLMQKRQRGETLSADEQQYLQRAVGARRTQQRESAGQPGGPGLQGRERAIAGEKTGLVPLCDMSASDRYKGEDGGLYGAGRNEPPTDHAAAARRELARIQPLDAEGKPAPDGKIVLLSIGMSNTTQEYSEFMRLARREAALNPHLVIVDGAFGGQDVMAWAEGRPIPRANNATPWDLALKRLTEAGVTAQQVQVVWLKQAKMGPASWGEFPAHARKLADGMATILNRAKDRYPNLRVAYLSSRIFAGHATTGLNPEPYSYESAFSVRWLIQEQIKGAAKLNYDAAKGAVKSPLLLWGPYLWTDGVAPRKSDGLVWKREDLASDGTHPSQSGQAKVAKMLVDFFKTNALAKTWFGKGDAPQMSHD